MCQNTDNDNRNSEQMEEDGEKELKEGKQQTSSKNYDGKQRTGSFEDSPGSIKNLSNSRHSPQIIVLEMEGVVESTFPNPKNKM